MSLYVTSIDMHTTLRPYEAGDYQQVLQLFLLNTPQYFAPQEQADLESFLNKEREEYYVITDDEGIIVACGGNNIKDNTGWLSWYIVHPECQGKGLGKMMVSYNLRSLKKKVHLTGIKVRTSQLVYRFYERSGFRLLSTTKDYWGEGLDLYEMELQVDAN